MVKTAQNVPIATPTAQWITPATVRAVFRAVDSAFAKRGTSGQIAILALLRTRQQDFVATMDRMQARFGCARMVLTLPSVQRELQQPLFYPHVLFHLKRRAICVKTL